jgi:hypothetical protein
MFRLLALAAAAVVVLTTAAPAHASSVRCKSAQLNEGGTSPAVHRLRAVNQPPKTDYYATPCLVAETTAREIRARRRAGKRQPRRIDVHGLNWDGGLYRCDYSRQRPSPVTSVSCRRIDKPWRRVTLRLAPPAS